MRLPFRRLLPARRPAWAATQTRLVPFDAYLAEALRRPSDMSLDPPSAKDIRSLLKGIPWVAPPSRAVPIRKETEETTSSRSLHGRSRL